MLSLANRLEPMGIEYKNGIKEDMARLYDASNHFHPEFRFKAELARLLNTSEQVLTNWESRGISDKGIVEASKKMTGLNTAWLKTGFGRMTVERTEAALLNPIIDSDTDFVGIQRVDLKISAGVSGYAVEYLDGERDPIFFRRAWMLKNGFKPEKLFALEVHGESMIPSLWEGDIVVANAADTKPIDTEVYAVNYEGELVIKRLVREAGNWYLSSDNSDKRKYPNKLCHEHCYIIGRVIYKQSERI